MKNKVSRREFLQHGTAVVLSATLTACGAQATEQPAEWETATPAKVLQSPMPPATADATATPEMDEALTQFLALSAALTGVPNLNPTLGRVYLQSLVNDSELGLTPADLFMKVQDEIGTSTVSLADLEAAAVFEQEETRKLADKIIEYWYTGTYKNEQEETAVATFVDSLAWKVLDYTKPQTICGAPYFWASRP